MIAEYICKGLLIGLIFGVPAGAIGALTIGRTLEKGVAAGFLTGIGKSDDCALIHGGVCGFWNTGRAGCRSGNGSDHGNFYRDALLVAGTQRYHGTFPEQGNGKNIPMAELHFGLPDDRVWHNNGSSGIKERFMGSSFRD